MEFFDGIGDWLIKLLYSLPGILLGLVLHEFAHAFAADRLGDPTPRMMGRLTLNPIAHIDPVGLLMLFIARFGWAKPVMTNPSRYKIKRYGFAIVGLAGPVTNFLLAAIFLAVLYTMYTVGWTANLNFLVMILFNAAWVNLALGIFNLLPIPPLDGYNILKDLILVRFVRSQTLWNIERYGTFILLGFIMGSRYLNINIVGTAVEFLLGVADNLYAMITGGM